MKKLTYLVFILSIIFSINSFLAQDAKKENANLKSALNGFKFRSIGPAFMSGRIADIAIDQKNDNTWYVAVGSGGLWKTKNAGTTWIPLTENQAFYSTGCVTIDPSNNSTIWLGT